ncbi:MAG: LysM peptidoglycan-binding domain-containing protein [Planctomycetes bacterium]|nr:LysM peptidoglycan-binding domain-containing protein [Planctomycetota bacterium]
MQRDVKVGLVFGILLVAGAAVLFFRRDEEDRDKFARLLPGPDAVAYQAKKALGPSPSDPYPVRPEFVADTWATPRPAKATNTPTPPRDNSVATNTQPPVPQKEDWQDSKKLDAPAVVLQPPEYAPKPAPRPKPEPVTSLSRQGAPSTSATPSASPQEYTVQEYDTLSDIAARKLGDASLWPQLYEANRGILPDPDHLPVGQKIRIPDPRKPDSRVAVGPAAATVANRSSRVPSGDRLYEVQDNETLSQIARRFYNDTSMYRTIYQANRDQLTSPDDVRVGMVLRLP